MSLIKEVQVGGKTVTFEFQKYAKQANGSTLVTCGDTQVLVTVCASDEPKDGQDFFPLTVDYVEKFYAVGKIPGGFVKRETRPSERENLTARVIDRPLRPSFPKDYLCDTHIVATVMSYDGENHPAILALLGASTALMISDIPFNGPVAALRVGYKNGEFVLNGPINDPESELELNIAANPDAVLMVEASANFLSEQKMIDAITFAHDSMKPIFEMQEQVQKEIGVPKRDLVVEQTDQSLWDKVQSAGKAPTLDAFAVKDKQMRGKALKAVGKKLKQELNPEGNSETGHKVQEYYEKLKYNLMRSMILDDKVRIDGRSFSDIRPISCETGIIRRTHGSALFTRGETQSICTVTLGSAEDEQRIDTILTPGLSKGFMLHYNFPPFSVGEARPLRAPGRREIGHGTLAENALTAVLPTKRDFGYTIRLVSEITESNGSSSMATVCGGTMAMLDAGVPLKAPVAGIAMGLVKEGDKYAVLSDILGDEDHLGDMDFKVTGSEEGITALQMDIKIDGLPRQILEEALEQAKQGRKFILGKIRECIETPNEISEWAPRIFQISIKTDKIKDLIGPGGKTIKQLVADFGVKIDIEDKGIVSIIAPDNETAEAVKKQIRAITADPVVGDIVMGTVKRIMDFGAFVEIKPGTEGLLHISQLEDRRVAQVSDVVQEGEQVMVKILDVDRQGKIKLSRKEALGKKPTVSSED